MSGASALASARRRRAGAEPTPINQNQQNRQTQQTEINTDQKYTPLQILQLHDTKIKTLEETLDEKILALVNKTVDEKLKTYQEATTSNNLKDENVINDNVNSKIESLMSAKLIGVNDTIKSILINIEKLSNLSIFNEKATNKIDELIHEMNSLKMLVIKNQTLSLETNGEMIKMKDNIKDVDSKVNDLQISNNNENIFNMENDAHVLLKSMLHNSQLDVDSFAKINIHDEEESGIEDMENLSENIEHIQLTDDMKNAVLEELSDLKEISGDSINTESLNSEMVKIE